MSQIALVVDFQIKPGCLGDFLSIIREHAAGTLADEEGCLQFDVLVPTEGGDRVLLYEAYQDDTAFTIHSNSERLAKTRSRYADMIADRTITRCTLN